MKAFKRYFFALLGIVLLIAGFLSIAFVPSWLTIGLVYGSLGCTAIFLLQLIADPWIFYIDKD